MKQKLSHIVTSPVAFGVRVEWLWSEGSHWFHRLELQYVRENQIPIVQIIEWPVTGTVISELKAGEKIHVRMRALDKEGDGPDWNASDWIEAASSTDVQEIVEHVLQSVNESQNFTKLVEETHSYGQSGTVTINTANFIRNYHGESDPRLMSVPDSDEAAKAAWSIKGHTDDAGVVHVAGMDVAVEDGQKQVEFKADRSAVIGTALSAIKNEQARIHAAEVKTRLSDDMREAVIDAIRESDVFKALQASQDAQASALVTTQ